MFPDTILARAETIIDRAFNKNLRIATAESCTGGLIGAALTEVSGSSAVFDGGFAVYSNAAKMSSLDVSRSSLDKHGAVSEQVAAEMAIGALKKMQNRVQIAISVTGIAGPNGGTAKKPVGLVCFGIAYDNNGTVPVVETEMKIFSDLDRTGVRQATVLHALKRIQVTINKF